MRSNKKAARTNDAESCGKSLRKAKKHIAAEKRAEAKRRIVSERAASAEKRTAKRKRIFHTVRLFLCALFIFAVVGTYIYAIHANTVYATVSISFAEIASGCNPDGSPFDIYEALSEPVLTEACRRLDGKVTPDVLKKHLSVTGITTDGSFSAIRQNVLNGNDTYSYFPSRYTISYSTVSDAILDEGFSATFDAVRNLFKAPSGAETVSAVAESYKDYYNSKYVTTSDMFSVDGEKIRSLDYFNRATEITNELTRINRYLNKRYERDVSFTASCGLGYGDLSAEASRLISADVSEYRAFIVANGITADKDKLLRQLRYVSLKSREQAQRSRGEYGIMLEGIQIYDPLVTKVVFIPALDADNDFYMNRTKIGIDYLTENASAASLAADEAENDAMYYDYLTEQFGKFDGNGALFPQAEKKCDEILAKAEEFIAKVSEVNDEYIESISYEKISVSEAERGQGIFSYAVVGIKMTVILSSIMYLSGLAISLPGKRRNKRKGERKNAAA